MNGLKKIMYGVTDFPLMRKENAYFVDCTALIRDLGTSATLRKSFQAKELGSSDKFISFLYVGHGPYLVRHEYEANGGFTDIAFHPQLDRWPQIAHASLIELKYFKASEKLTRQKLAQTGPARTWSDCPVKELLQCV